ncbi:MULTISPECIES: ABC transporter permease [Streptomyces]|uniref:ABC transporter permease n=1 Tax=Streptomyces TaxID=1883 RepID=UPI00345BD71F
MLRTAVRNVFAYKARLMMTVLAVVLGTAFVSGTLILSDTVGNAYKSSMSKSLKNVAVSVRSQTPPGAAEKEADGRRSSSALDDPLAGELRELPGVTSVRASVRGNAVVAGKGNQPLGNEWGNWGTNYIPDKDGNDSAYPLKEGRGPVTSDEIALDAHTAAAGGYKPGDTVRFATDGPALHKRLVGTVDNDNPQLEAGASLVLFDTATAQKLFLRPGQYDEMVLAAAPGTDYQALTQKVRDILPKDRATATSGPDLADQASKAITERSSSLTKTLLVFAGIALFIGVFIIANTFTMLITERSREIALLRAVGASRRQVVRSVLAEAGLLGLASSVLGIVFGTGIAIGLRPLLNAGGAGFPDGPLVISPATVLSTLGVGVLVTVLAAWLPSRKAANIAPIEALRTVDATPARLGLVVRTALGAAVTAAGTGVMRYVTTLNNSEGIMPAMLGSALVLVGLILLAPLLSRPVILMAGMPATRLFGVSGKLAKENALSNPRRTAATASALMVGLALVTGLTTVGHSAQLGINAMTTKGLAADYNVEQSNHKLPIDTSDKLRRLPGVAAAAPMTSASFTAGDQRATLTGTDTVALGKTVNLKFASGSLADIGNGKIAVSETFAKKAGYNTGDRVEAHFTQGAECKQTFHVVGVYEDNLFVGQALGTTSDIAQNTHDPNTVRSVLIKAANSQAAGLDQQIRTALGDSPLLKIQDKNTLQTERAERIGTALLMLYGLLAMAIVIAVLGIINTLAMSVTERTREIGMLRAIGLSRDGIRQMIRLESVMISFCGAILGISTGAALAWAGSSLLRSSFPQYETALPWGTIGLFLLTALVVGALAAVWPARRAARLNMLQSISTQ